MFSTDFRKILISNCMTVSPEGAELLMLTDRHDDLIVYFHNFANAPINVTQSIYHQMMAGSEMRVQVLCPHHTLLSSKNKLDADRSTCTFLFLVLA
jgi:hypothetical protein